MLGNTELELPPECYGSSVCKVKRDIFNGNVMSLNTHLSSNCQKARKVQLRVMHFILCKFYSQRKYLSFKYQALFMICMVNYVERNRYP